jgi:hypothetical protein
VDGHKTDYSDGVLAKVMAGNDRRVKGELFGMASTDDYNSAGRDQACGVSCLMPGSFKSCSVFTVQCPGLGEGYTLV